ncbi:Katanin p60 ATPase-containing subunit A1 [Asimina triloba]
MDLGVVGVRGKMGTYARLAKRALETDMPVMVQIQELIRGAKDSTISLAQVCLDCFSSLKLVSLFFVSAVSAKSGARYLLIGDMSLLYVHMFKHLRYSILSLVMVCRFSVDSGVDCDGVVYWHPPERALEKIKESVYDPIISRYGADEGLPELRAALVEKLRRENNLHKSSVMVTAGANQAFVNLALTLCDPGDSVVMFAPYYFNSYMSFQMTGITDILVGPANPKTLQPDVDWLEKTLSEEENKSIPKVVSVVNPGNPSGTYIPEHLLKGDHPSFRSTHHKDAPDAQALLLHYFLDSAHECIVTIAFPSDADGLAAQLLKVQDNIPICASIIGQHLALYSLEEGLDWIKERVKDLVKSRDLLREALSPLGEDAVKGGEGAIYLWAKLPDKYPDDFAVVRWLVRRHGVVVIPGSASGGPGNIRISFGGLKYADCQMAAEKLRRGLKELVTDGMVE